MSAPSPDAIRRVAELGAALLEQDGISLPPTEIAPFIADLLLGPHALWLAAEDGLVTSTQAAGAIMARLQTWAVRHAGCEPPEASAERARRWDAAIAEVKTALFGVG